MFSSDKSADAGIPHWYAVLTRNCAEKKVCERLRSLGMECYTPLLRVPRRWNNRQRVMLEVPIFPQYVFVCMDPSKRICVLRVPGVVRFVEEYDGPVQVNTEEMEALRISVTSYRVAPHAYLRAGRVANVIRGPLQGRQGILSDDEDLPLVLNFGSVNLAIAVGIDKGDLNVCTAGTTGSEV